MAASNYIYDLYIRATRVVFTLIVRCTQKHTCTHLRFVANFRIAYLYKKEMTTQNASCIERKSVQKNNNLSCNECAYEVVFGPNK